MMFSQLITTIVPDSSLSIPKICNLLMNSKLIKNQSFIIKIKQIALYFAAVSVICTFSIFCNVAVLVLHHRNVSIQG